MIRFKNQGGTTDFIYIMNDTSYDKTTVMTGMKISGKFKLKTDFNDFVPCLLKRHQNPNAL